MTTCAKDARRSEGADWKELTVSSRRLCIENEQQFGSRKEQRRSKEQGTEESWTWGCCRLNLQGESGRPAILGAGWLAGLLRTGISMTVF